MEIIVKQRDHANMSHGAVGHSIEMWDVYQGDALVGVYHNESDALKYKAILESGRLNELLPSKK